MDANPTDTAPVETAPTEAVAINLDTPETVESLSGVADGTVLASGEIVTGSFDLNGKLTGWSKNAPKEGTL